MQAILTFIKTRSDKKRKRTNHALVARTASGRTHSIALRSAHAPERTHRLIAVELSERMGWGRSVVGGETREGFAYVPVPPAAPTITPEVAAAMIKEVAASLTSSHQDPRAIAKAIRHLSHGDAADQENA